MPPEFLTVTPQRVRCYVCGTFTESPVGWKYRLRLGGHSPICPSCVSRAEHEIDEMTAKPECGRCRRARCLAAVAGSIVWFGLTVATEHIYWFVAMGIGWIVGKAVAFGSGNKRGPALQVAAAALAFAGILGEDILFLTILFPN